MGHGGARPNSGPKKGTKYRFDKALAQKLKEQGRVDPLDLLLAVAEDAELPIDVRIRAANFAAPYVHRRRPQALEVTGQIEHLSPEEVATRREMLLEEIRQRQARAALPGRN